MCQGVRNLTNSGNSAPDSIAVFLCVKFSNLVCFIAIKHSLRITTSYLCREGGE
nr:MAG TPA: hypothetical protein [Caudoviricetes sp.]